MTTLPSPPPGFQLIDQTPPPPPPGFQIVDAQPMATEEPEASWLDTIMDYGQGALRRTGYLSQEAARGVTQMLGAPVDLVNISPMAMNLLPGVSGFEPISDNPVGGSKMLWDVLTAPRDAVASVAGVQGGDGQPQDAFDRIGGRITQELGAAALPVAGVISAGNRLGVQGARAMQESARPIARFGGRMAETAAVNPSRFAANEFGYAAAAGTGAGLAREVAPEGNEEIADILGALAGAGGLALGQTIARTGGDVASAVSGRGGSQVVRDEVAGQIGRAAGAPTAPSGAIDTSGLAQVLRTGRDISEVIPGFRPTSADVAQNPGLAALEYGRSSGGPNTGLYAQRRADNQAAATDAVTDLRPQSTPGAFSSAARTERDTLLQDAELKTYLAETQFDDAVENLRAVQSGEARGQTIRAALDDALSSAREVERAAWSVVQGEADPAPLAQRFSGVTDGLTASERRVVGDMMAAIDTPASFDGPVRLEEITSLRSELTSAVREAAGDPNKQRIISRYVDELDSYLDSAPDLSEALASARAVSRDLNDRFTRRGSAIADALAKRPSGGPAMPDSRVAPRFVQPDNGQASEMDRLLREAGEQIIDPAAPTGSAVAQPSAAPATNAAPASPNNLTEVREALRDQILSDVNSRGILAKPDRLDEYLGQYQQVFDRFPELREELGTAAGLRRAADEAADAKKTLTRELGGPDGQPGASSVAKYLAFGDERAPDAMASVVNARDPAKAADDLMRFVKDDPQAAEGARAAFWQLMEKRTRSSGATTKSPGGEQPFRFQQLDNFLRDPATRAVAERLYRDNPEHLNNLSQIAESLRAVNFGQTGRAPNTSGTPQGLKGSEVLPSTETLGSRSFAFARGQVGLPFLALNIGSTIARRAILRGRGQEFQELLDKALLDPKLAATLLEQSNPANIKAMTRAAKVHFGVRAAWLDDLVTDSEEPSLEDQIME
jgi:DNA-binding transcriptional ArsR family regulator